MTDLYLFSLRTYALEQGQEGRRSLWDSWEYAFYFLSQNLGNAVYYTVLQRLLLSMRMKNRYANRLSWKNIGGIFYDKYNYDQRSKPSNTGVPEQKSGHF